MAGFFTNKDISAGVNESGSKLPQCGKCGLAKKCISPKMEYTGKGKRKILFVAEAPGEKEDMQGIQLIGEPGQRLRKSLHNIDIELDDCWKTNAVICRPAKNKIEPYMISCCRPNLIKTIKELKPRVIIILGSSALQSLLFKRWEKDVGPLSRWVGWNIPDKDYNCWLCPTYHPSYLLKMNEDTQLVQEFEKHLVNAVNLEKKKPRGFDVKELEKKIEIIKNPKDAFLRMKDLSKKKGIVSFDYEASGLKPEKEDHYIASVSFCFEGKDTFALLYDERHKNILKKILCSIELRKVAANLKYEDRWSKAILGCRVRGWYWDTMLMAHVLDNRKMITALKFQTFIHFGIQDYDSHIAPMIQSKYSNTLNRVNKIPADDLLLYNGLDSLLEYKLMEKQKQILFMNRDCY